MLAEGDPCITIASALPLASLKLLPVARTGERHSCRNIWHPVKRPGPVSCICIRPITFAGKLIGGGHISVYEETSTLHSAIQNVAITLVQAGA